MLQWQKKLAGTKWDSKGWPAVGGALAPPAPPLDPPLSMMAAECVACYETSLFGIWLQNFVTGLRIADTIQAPLKMYCDNNSAVMYANNNRSSANSKHIDVKFLFVKQGIEDKYSSLGIRVPRQDLILWKAYLPPLAHARGQPRCYSVQETRATSADSSNGQFSKPNRSTSLKSGVFFSSHLLISLFRFSISFHVVVICSSLRLCEQLMYPAAPMALRISGILMGGVVIVYEQKVKLLLDDVNRAVDELNSAWTVKPRKLRKGKAKARYETATWHDDAMPFNTANPQGTGGSPGQQDEQAQKDDTPVRPKAPRWRATRRNVSRLQIDNEEILVPSAVYESWLDDTSDIVSIKRSISPKRRKFKQVLQHQNLTTLMELPPVAIITTYEFPSGFYYPKALMELWKKSTRPMPRNRDTPPEAQHPQNTTNIPEEFYHQDLPEFPPEMFPDDLRQYNPDDSVERMRDDPGQHSNHFTPSSPGNYAGSAQSGRSSGSGPTLPVGENDILPTGRSKKRQQSSIGGSHLETVEEEGPPHETETLVETGPTQTPLQSTSSDDSVDPMTPAMRFQLKAPKHESLSRLAQGMNPSQAAKLFFQTCVLATRCDLKVEQDEPYGETNFKGSQYVACF
ncbi:hypothetical protein LUZ61_015916 [Rhynchospora tenuis]|uniref:Rad21/Rec8-like protein N-terminal domain-containing protein n=1 Tax=Rhynchospora tenuis TaxID=198213 RepID=A0AAD5Z4J0_9POAL|nr:hypothetical protein LUZ61_015916 [Rhynchospora tenuis]